MCIIILKSVVFTYVHLISVYKNIYASHSESGGIINTEVITNIDISGPFVHKSHVVTILNVNNETIFNYVFSVEHEISVHLAYIEARYFYNKKAIIIEQNHQSDTDLIYTLTLQRKCNMCSVTILIEQVYVDYLIPYPSLVKQNEKHLVLFHGNDFFYTPYLTKNQICYIVVGNGKIIDIKGYQYKVISGNIIKSGKSIDVLPYTLNTVRIHYENNSPFLKIIHLERSIKLSHWGYIHVEDRVTVKNDAAIFKGGFNRILTEYQSFHGTLVSSFTSTLPAEAFDIYYKDSIGNILTSNVEKFDNFTTVKITPRFLLYGGWEISYVLGYALKCDNYLFNYDIDKNIYVLKMNILDSVFSNMIIDQALFKIHLPEGANEINLDIPFAVTFENNSVDYTYCDTVGHTVITMSAAKLINKHITHFALYYIYNNFMLVLKPFAISLFNMAAFILFLICRIVFSKLSTL